MMLRRDAALVCGFSYFVGILPIRAMAQNGAKGIVADWYRKRGVQAQESSVRYPGPNRLCAWKRGVWNLFTRAYLFRTTCTW